MESVENGKKQEKHKMIFGVHWIYMFAAGFVIALIKEALERQPPTDGSFIFISVVGFALGSSLALMAIATVIVAIPAGIYKLIKKKELKGAVTAFWSVWALFEVMSLYGSYLQTQIH